MKRIAFALVLSLAASLAHAGGTAFSCHVVDLKRERSERFVVTIKPTSVPDTQVTYTSDGLLVLHISRSTRSPLPSGNEPVSREDFSEAMDRLQLAAKSGAGTRLGILGNALLPVTGRPGHYRVYALRIEDEGPATAGPERYVVYAQ